MKYQIFSDNEWLYPDSVITMETSTAKLAMAKNASDCFQILTDTQVSEGEKVEIEYDGQLEVTVYQLMRVRVEENSGVDFCTTLDYDAVKDFVERQAPYYVYDVTRDIDDACLKEERAAFYVRVKADIDTHAGDYHGKLKIRFKGETVSIGIDAKVHKCSVPKLEDAKFGMVNWIYPKPLCVHHNVEEGSDKFFEIFEKYIDNELDMRNTHFQLPSGVPIRDENGKVIDFDFTLANEMGDIALKKGFNYVYGGFVARFLEWDKPGQYLLWDRDVEAGSMEGYRQLRIYFTKLWSEVQSLGWGDRYMQGLVDEPQFANSAEYRILSNICRQLMPGIVIIDPVESTELYGSLEIWVIKQEVYQKHAEKFEDIRKLGGELWVYTCGFPANDWMNRAIDLHPLAGRLPMWMAVQYNMKGFLHWGYNSWNPRPFEDSCFIQSTRRLPSGDGYIVYPGNNKPWDSIRSHLQRAGAEEAELLMQLTEKDEAKAREIISKVCTTFKVYSKSASEFAAARNELLEALDIYA